jgi:hypothetical protein
VWNISLPNGPSGRRFSRTEGNLLAEWFNMLFINISLYAYHECLHARPLTTPPVCPQVFGAGRRL